MKRRPLEDDVFVVDVVGRHRRFQTATFRKTFGSLSRVIQVNWIDTLSTQTLFSSIHDYLARGGPDEIIVGMAAEKRKERKRIKSDCFFSYLINDVTNGFAGLLRGSGGIQKKNYSPLFTKFKKMT